MNHELEEMMFINNQMQNKNYLVLPSTIAKGKVYKISLFGNLDKDGMEVGYLHLTVGSGIKEHTHISDIERYKLLIGELKINGDSMNENICLLNNCHSIDEVSKITVIQFCKVNKLYLNKLDDFSAESFDKMIDQNVQQAKVKRKK